MTRKTSASTRTTQASTPTCNQIPQAAATRASPVKTNEVAFIAGIKGRVEPGMDGWMAAGWWSFQVVQNFFDLGAGLAKALLEAAV